MRGFEQTRVVTFDGEKNNVMKGWGGSVLACFWYGGYLRVLGDSNRRKLFGGMFFGAGGGRMRI